MLAKVDDELINKIAIHFGILSEFNIYSNF